MKLDISRTRLWTGLIAFILLMGMTGYLPSVQAEDPSTESLANAIRSTFKVFGVDANLKLVSGCSATLIDPAGYVLTNFHCVGYTKGQKDQGTPGTMKNPQGFVALGPTVDPKKAAVPTYWARFIAGNYDQDVAILKITSMFNKGQSLPKTLPMPSIKRADSDRVQVGDYIAAIGYPGIGGNTVTFTDGKVSGFDDMNDDGTLDSFRVTADINHGNSGGLAINQKGEQIGLPTWGVVRVEDVSKVNGVLMVNFAEPYIRKALALGNVAGGPLAPTPQPKSTPPPKSTTPIANSPFTNLRFGTDYQDHKLIGEAKSFPAGTKQLTAVWDYAGIAPGTDWGDVWELDGEEILGEKTGQAWDGESEQGIMISDLGKKTGALPNGEFRYTLYVNGAVAASATATVGKVDNSPQPPPASSSQVIVRGQIIDASTKRGIPNAAIGFMNPGVTADDFNAATTGEQVAELMFKGVFTDQSGYYLVAEGLPRGYTYPVIVNAPGYVRREFWGGIKITNEHSASLEIEPIELKRN